MDRLESSKTTKKRVSGSKKSTPVKRKRGAAKGKKRSTASKKRRGFKSLMWRFILNVSILGLFLLGGFLALIYFGAFGHIPTKSELERIKNPVASEIYSADNKLLGRYYLQNRSNVKYNEIAPHVINALVATEDARFYKHKGVDEIALLRVFFKTLILRQRSAGGGSTLSQQTVKNIYGRKDFGKVSTPVNKFRESIIAYRLESIFSKEEILTLYLNTVPFGEQLFGIETAAERFFSTSAKNLNLMQAATLVGMLKANNSYNPRVNPERSLKRRNVVMNQMVKEEYITQANYDKYKKYPLGVKYNKLIRTTGSAQYFRELIRLKMARWCKDHHKENGDPYNLYVDGLKIYTTIDSRMQSMAESSVQKQISAVQKEFNNHWSKSKPWDRDRAILTRAIKSSTRYRALKKAGTSSGDIDKILKRKNGDGISPLDSIKRELMVLHPGFIAMDPNTGDIKAWVGGRKFSEYQYDQILARRQVGSTFKPIVYATAIANGADVGRYISCSGDRYPNFQNWSPKNSDGKYGGYYTMKGALTNSVNTIAVKVLMETGIESVIAMAKRMGIESDLPSVPSLALGAAEISMLDMAECYSVFASGGIKREPRFITKIVSEEGVELEVVKRDGGERIFSKKTTAILNNFTQSVVDNGTGKRLRREYGVTGDIGGKTGTTQNGADGWFIGYTPKLVVASRISAVNPYIHFRTIKYGQGAYLGLPQVGNFYQKLYRSDDLKKYRGAKFTQPSSAILAQISQPLYKDVLAIDIPESAKVKSVKESKKIDSEIVTKPTQTDDATDDKGKKKKKRGRLWKKIKGVFKK